MIDKQILKLLLMYYLAIFITLGVVRCAFAADYLVRGGPAIVEGKPTGRVKYFGLRREAYELYGLYNAVEAGGWVDVSGNGQTSGLFKTQLGLAPGPETGVFTKAFFGPCFITTPDAVLGGRFPQFCTDFGVGTRDSRSSVAIVYSHVSSAGLVKPNRGRDFILLEMGLRF